MRRAGAWLCAAAVATFATFATDARAGRPGIAGTWVHVRDSDGTTPAKGARVELTFAGAQKGTVKLHATRPGETYEDPGTWSARGGAITIRFREVEWAAAAQPFQVDACTLTLPFLALSPQGGAGSSTWRRQDPACAESAAGGGGTAGAGPEASGGKEAVEARAVSFQPFAADMVVTEGGQKRRVRLFVTQAAVRSERDQDGKPVVAILRLDRGLLWTLDPAARTYRQTRLPIAAGASFAQPVGPDPSCQLRGEDVVAGRKCRREECRSKLGDREHRETRWVAPGLGGIAIRYASDVHAFELTRIDPGPQDPALFELPPGFREASP